MVLYIIILFHSWLWVQRTDKLLWSPAQELWLSAWYVTSSVRSSTALSRSPSRRRLLSGRLLLEWMRQTLTEMMSSILWSIRIHRLEISSLLNLTLVKLSLAICYR